MDYLFILEIAKAVLRELWRRKYLAMLGGTLIAFACLAVGFMWQEQFEVNTTLYADSKDIISPLLKGQAKATSVENQRQVVKDIMLSSKVLDQIVREEGFLSEDAEYENLDATVSVVASGLRNRVSVRMLAKNYVGVSFVDANPDRAFAVVTRLVDHFITESSANKKSESQKAFAFIDKQARAYQDQLRAAEERLKIFKANNTDGTESQVNSKIENLRNTISNLTIDIEQIQARIGSLRAQIANEDRYLTRRAKADEYNQRIVQAVQDYDNLRLTYTDSHPDVVAVKQYIEELKAASADGKDSGVSGLSTSVENPVYDELRGALANASIEKQGELKRLNSIKALLAKEMERKQRIAEKNAELAELTSGYDVTKDLYEDLLEKKEQARMSMALDIEGQGVSYQIQEPPVYPVVPVGFSFIHFVLLGCLAAVAVPICLAVAYIVLDPRVRFLHTVETSYDVDLLGEIPHYVSVEDRVDARKSAVVFLFLGCLIAAVYIAAAFAIKLFG